MKSLKIILTLILLFELTSCMYYSFPTGYNIWQKTIKNYPTYSIDGKRVSAGREVSPFIESRVHKARRIRQRDTFILRLGFYDSISPCRLIVKLNDSLIEREKDDYIHSCNYRAGENYFIFKINSISNKDTLLIKTEADSIKMALIPKYPAVRVTLIDGMWNISYHIYKYLPHYS